jgi:hypothetical protein
VLLLLFFVVVFVSPLLRFLSWLLIHGEIDHGSLRSLITGLPLAAFEIICAAKLFMRLLPRPARMKTVGGRWCLRYALSAASAATKTN